MPGTPLTIGKAGSGRLTLSWGASCVSTDSDYEIYEGNLGDFTSHYPRYCAAAGGTAFTLKPGADNTYYLVVPTNGIFEGSYGTDSNGIERPAAAVACADQSTQSCE